MTEPERSHLATLFRLRAETSYDASANDTDFTAWLRHARDASAYATIGVLLRTHSVDWVLGWIGARLAAGEVAPDSLVARAARQLREMRAADRDHPIT